MGQPASCREGVLPGVEWGVVQGELLNSALPTLSVVIVKPKCWLPASLPTCIDMLNSKDDGAGDLFHHEPGEGWGLRTDLASALCLHSPRWSFPCYPIWLDPQLPSVHSLMLIPNRACAADSWQGQHHPCIGFGKREAAISIRRMAESAVGLRGFRSSWWGYKSSVHKRKPRM